MDCVNGTKIGIAKISAVYGFGVQVSKEFLSKVKSEIVTDDRCRLLQAGNYYDNVYRYYLVVNGDSLEEILENKKHLQEFIDDWEHQLLLTVPDWESKKVISKVVDVCFS